MITTNLVPTFSLTTLETPLQTYILGWLLGSNKIEDTQTITLAVKEKDIDCLVAIKDQINPLLAIEHDKKKQLVSLSIQEESCWLAVQTYSESSKDTDFFANTLLAKERSDLALAFVKGYFECCGHILPIQQHLAAKCFLTHKENALLKNINQWLKIPSQESPQQIVWEGCNAVDFLGKIYDNQLLTPYLRSNFQDYQQLCWWTFSSANNLPPAFTQFQWSKTRPDAQAPFKKRISDSGYDLTLVEKIKENGLLQVYETGIKVKPPFGYYFDLVPRSSLSKTGYVLANSVGIIDRTYRGTIKVALVKVDSSKPDLTLPMRLVQLIPRPIQHFEAVELANLNETDRNEGGFGSTN